MNQDKLLITQAIEKLQELQTAMATGQESFLLTHGLMNILLDIRLEEHTAEILS